MDATHEGMPRGGLSPGGSRVLSRLDEVGADARLADAADEYVDSAEGDPVSVLN